ncbi:MAG: 3-hydroxyacyl-CoA dehydrogenase [Deltaproteobacteria bacterium]|nr:3-hydroxyacyl-CoA dehydrogenase [Deltaproteobacteria bacterium]
MADKEHTAAVIGGGTMGADIAAVFIAGGWFVHIVDLSGNVRKNFPARLSTTLAKLGNHKAKGSFFLHSTIGELPWDDVEIVVEAVSEDLHLKQQIFGELVTLSQPHIPLTSNSSGFPISQIGKGLTTQNRMMGLHFFMPAHLVPLVEVISSEFTDSSIAQDVVGIMKDLEKRPVQVKKDIPGFLANRIKHALMREALYLVEQGIASPEDVDVAVRYGFGFRYIAAGPLLQKDLSGLDIQYSAAKIIYPDLCNATEPSLCLRKKVEKGHVGIKTGRGFYRWTKKKIDAVKLRYEKMLQAAIGILKSERQE